MAIPPTPADDRFLNALRRNVPQASAFVVDEPVSDTLALSVTGPELHSTVRLSQEMLASAHLDYYEVLGAQVAGSLRAEAAKAYTLLLPEVVERLRYEVAREFVALDRELHRPGGANVVSNRLRALAADYSRPAVTE